MTENRNREGLKNCTSLKVDMSTIPLIKVSSYVGKDTSNQSVEDLRYSYTINSAHLHSTTVSKFPPQVTAMWLLSLSFWILLYIWLVWKIWNLMRLEWTKKESPVFHFLSLFFSPLQHLELPLFQYASTFQHLVVLNRVGSVAMSQEPGPPICKHLRTWWHRAPLGPCRGSEEQHWNPSLQGQGFLLQLSGSTPDPMGGQGDWEPCSNLFNV